MTAECVNMQFQVRLNETCRLASYPTIRKYFIGYISK